MRNEEEMDLNEEGEEFLEEEFDDGDDPVMEILAASMPWVISILFHVGLFLVLIFIVLFSESVEEDPPPAFIGPEHAKKTGAKVTPRKTKTTKKTSSARKSIVPKKSVVNVSGKTNSTLAVTGIAGGGCAAGGMGSGTHGTGLPGTGFCGNGGRAHNVIYVIDRSGSMMETFDALRMEMRRSIGKLQSSQTFQIIFFSDEAQPEQFGGAKGTLVDATRLNKKKAGRYITDKVVPRGQTDPVPALKRAFQVLRDAKKAGSIIFLLTDGRFPDNEQVLAAIKEGNVKNVAIYTYLYGHQPEDAVRVMTKIATENSGKYTAVESY